MTVQRRRHGLPVTLYPAMLITDSRGNQVLTPDKDNPITGKAAAIPQRSQRAEVIGQQMVDVVRLIVDIDLRNVDLWGEVTFMGDDWDIASPPAYHHGTRQTRHWSVDIRRRPT